MLSEKAKQNKRKYNIKYQKENYKRIPLDVTPEKYEEIKTAAEQQGEKVNTYIKKAIEQRMEKEKP